MILNLTSSLVFYHNNFRSEDEEEKMSNVETQQSSDTMLKSGSHGKRILINLEDMKSREGMKN